MPELRRYVVQSKTQPLFWGMLYLVLGIKLKRGLLILVISQCRPMLESSRRELLNDLPEHRPSLTTRIGFTPKTEHSLKRGFVFTVKALRRESD